jgi:hypothetical protein
MAISDGAHSGGTPGFYFLPPMVPLPVTSGVFDADIATFNPAILICDVTDGPDTGCGGAIPALRAFTTTSTPAIVLDGEKYKVDWDTKEKEGDFVAGRTYRVHVLGGSGPNQRELGFADVLLTTEPGKVKNLATEETITLNDGRTLPIHVRIEVGVVVPPGPAVAFELTGLPASAVAGSDVSVTVTARDANGQVATGYRGTVAFTATDPQADLPANHVFTEGDAGSHTFTGLSFKTAGSVMLRVEDAADAAVFGEATLTVEPAAAALLELTGLIDAEAGTAQTLTVTARDAFGNVATGYLGTIGFTSTDEQASLPDDYMFEAPDAGTRTFPVVLHTAGEVTVTATDEAASITGSQSVTIAPAAAATLVVTGLVDGAAAGTAQTLTVEARDASGNRATGYVGRIVFTSSDAQAILPDPYTFKTEDAGMRSFSGVELRTAGTQNVTATDETIVGITGGQTVLVVAAAAAELVVEGIPDPATAGVANDVTVTARDAFGNTATGYAGTVQFSSSDPQAVLPPPYAFQSGDAGVHTFAGGITFKTAGEQSLTVSDGTLSAVLSVIVQPAAAAALRFTTQPSGALAGDIISPAVVVTAYDAFDNVATAFTGQVTIAIGTNPGGGALSGTLQRNAVLGVATFDDLSIDKGGSGYTLVASASGLTGATSDPFDIAAPTPTDAHWINAAGGLWSVGSNWNTGTAPTSGQVVFIDLDGTYTVTLDVDAIVPSLTLGAASGMQALNVGSGRMLTISTSGDILSTGRLMLDGALTLNGATLNGSGTLSVAAGGTLTLQNGDLNTPLVNAGTVLSLGSSSMDGSVTTVAGSLLRVQGVSGLNATLTVASSFTNEGAIELTSSATANVTLSVTSGTLTNAADGTIRSLVGLGGGRTLTAQLDNQGTLTVAQTLTINRGSAQHTNSGLIELTGGILGIQGSGTTPSFTNTGTVTVSTGRLLVISVGSFTQASGATLDGGGALELRQLNAFFETGFTLSELRVFEASATLATDISTAGATVRLRNATIHGPGTLTNAAGELMDVFFGTINAPLVNAGLLVVHDEGAGFNVVANRVNGSFTTVAGSVLRVSGGSSGAITLRVSSDFTNHGTVELTNRCPNCWAQLTVNGTLVNAADGTIRSLAGAGGGARTLTAQLDNQGTLTVAQTLTINGASAQHTNSGLIELTGGNLPVTQSGTSPSFTNNGVMDLGTGLSARLSGGTFSNQAGASIQGTGTFEAGSTTPFSNAGSVTANLVRVGNTLTGDGTFAPVTAEFFGSATSIPAASNYSYTHVRVLSAAAFAGSKSLTGNLTVAGSGNLTIGAHEIVVGGNFATQNTSLFTMQDAAGVLAVTGSATFGGGSTDTRLTAGTLRVGGNIAQAGGSAAAFAAASGHLTVLNGTAAQSVSFANPGAATSASHFQRLEIANASAGGVVLNSAAFANGQLRTPSGADVARLVSGAGFLLTAGGLDAYGLVFDGIPLYVVMGEAITRFDNATFRNMDAAAIQFRLDRLADAVTFNNTTFETEPTTGVYLHLVDTDAGGTLFTVTMQNTTPANHGGKVFESIAGQLQGWPF